MWGGLGQVDYELLAHLSTCEVDGQYEFTTVEGRRRARRPANYRGGGTDRGGDGGVAVTNAFAALPSDRDSDGDSPALSDMDMRILEAMLASDVPSASSAGGAGRGAALQANPCHPCILALSLFPMASYLLRSFSREGIGGLAKGSQALSSAGSRTSNLI